MAPVDVQAQLVILGRRIDAALDRRDERAFRFWSAAWRGVQARRAMQQHPAGRSR